MWLCRLELDISFTHDLASQVHGSVVTMTDIMSELYMVNVGVGNSFVINLLFLSLIVFQKRKSQSKFVLGYF